MLADHFSRWLPEETDNSSLASNEDHFESPTSGVSSRYPVHPLKGILEKVWAGVIGMALALERRT